MRFRLKRKFAHNPNCNTKGSSAQLLCERFSGWEWSWWHSQNSNIKIYSLPTVSVPAWIFNPLGSVACQVDSAMGDDFLSGVQQEIAREVCIMPA